MTASADPTDARFGTGEPFSLGVEEELFLVDPVTGDQANASAAVTERLGPVDGTVERELHACQIELITDVCATAAQAVGTLGGLRRAVMATGAGLLGSGTHPRALEGEAEITDKERYERISRLLGDAVADPVGGLHVHVGMPDEDHAVRAFNGLRGDLPLLQALAANSPYRHGRDTGLASAREVAMRGWARSGVPRVLRDYDDFCALAASLARVAEVPDYTWFWWKLRPHPRLGTVEIRALDAQASLDDLAALIALAHCLARHHATASDVDAVAGPPPEIVDEGFFRAGRYGVAGALPGPDGDPTPVAELVTTALDRARDHADDLGCRDALERVPELVERGGGAGRQRRAHAIGGMSMLLRETAALTAADGPEGPLP